MRLKNIFIISSLLLLTNYISAQNFKSHKFSGKVTVEDGNAKDVTIKVFDRNKCFSSYQTKLGGKFYFAGSSERYYTLRFEKEGYVPKMIVIKTFDTRKLKEDTRKYKFDVELKKEKEGINYDEEDFPVAIIEYDKKTKSFKHNKKYSSKLRTRKNLYAAK